MVRPVVAPRLAQTVAHHDVNGLGVEVVVTVDLIHRNPVSEAFVDHLNEVSDTSRIVGNDQDGDGCGGGQ